MAFFVALAETEWEAIFRLWQVWLSFHSFLLVDYFLSHPSSYRQPRAIIVLRLHELRK
jgi:hypothetical protein